MKRNKKIIKLWARNNLLFELHNFLFHKRLLSTQISFSTFPDGTVSLLLDTKKREELESFLCFHIFVFPIQLDKF